MYANLRELYYKITPYIIELIGDQRQAVRLAELLPNAKFPLQSFLTAAKLYLKLLEIRNEKDPESIASKMKEYFYNNFYVFIVVSCISAKYYRDVPFTNSSWENITYFPLNDLNEFEIFVLEILNYEIDAVGDFEIYRRVKLELRKREIVIPKKKKSLVHNLLCL